MKNILQARKLVLGVMIFVSIILILLLINFTTTHHIRGEELAAGDIEQYYLLEEDNENFQTFQFQSCRVLTYSVVGQIIGKKVSGGFKINKMTFKAYILNGSIHHVNNGIRVSNANFRIDEDSNAVIFDYDLDFYSKKKMENEEVLHTLDMKGRDLIVKPNYDFNFVPKTKSRLLDFYCEISETYSTLAPLYPGGGYECNGSIVIK